MYKIFKITVLLNGDILRVHYYKTKLGEYASNFRSNIENYLDSLYKGVDYVILKTFNTGVSYLELKYLCSHREAQIQRGTGDLASYRSDLSKLRDILDEVGNYSKVTKHDVDYKMGRLLHG